MYKILKHIPVVFAAMTLLLASCSDGHEAEVIPRRQLAEIYAEMLVTDQWITSTPGVRMIADTSLVYAPILEKYGYDLDDYLLTVEEYMDDPERFSRILRRSGEIIGRQIEDAEKRMAKEELLAGMPKIDAEFDLSEFFPYVFDEPYVHYYDSLTFEPDSLLQIYRLIPVERTDTIFDGIRITVRTDSLAVSDTSFVVEPAIDSTAVEVVRDVEPIRKDVSSMMKADRKISEIKQWESKE